MPKQFDIAVCSRGELGVITSPEPISLDYGNGQTGIGWAGIHLSPSKLGQPWSSRNPKVLFTLEDLKELLETRER